MLKDFIIRSRKEQLEVFNELWGSGNSDKSSLDSGIGLDYYTKYIDDTFYSEISAGDQAIYLIKTDGTLWAFGNGRYGSLANDSEGNSQLPQQVGNLTTWSKVKGRNYGAMALKTDGTIWAWGYNAYGNLGLSDIVDRSSPVQVGNESYSEFFPTLSSSYGIRTDGTLWAWGSNGWGNLGLEDTISRSSPTQVGVETSWYKVVSDGTCTIGYMTDGTLWAWGVNNQGELGVNDNVSRSSPVLIGVYDSLTDLTIGGLIKSDGTLWTWGNNNYGGLGLGDTNHRSSPVQVGTLNTWSKIKYVGISKVAKKTDGTLWAMGGNSFNPLGTEFFSMSSPVQVGNDSDWLDYDLGSNNSIAKKNDGKLYLLATDISKSYYNQSILYRKSSPVQVTSEDKWISFDTKFSSRDVYAIKSDNTLWGWGLNDYDITDLGQRHIAYPKKIGTSADWESISVSSHIMGIKNDGTLWTWGLNNFNQLGLLDTINRSSPTQVGTLSSWLKISAGSNFSVAIRTDGTLWTWGSNSSGNLGLSDILQRSSPVQVGTLNNWSDVYAGTSEVLALKTDGTLWSWGNNTNGRLGFSDVTNRSSPVQVGTDTNWSKIYTQFGTSFAIKTDNSLYGWGYNQYGNLGISKNTSIPYPVIYQNQWSSEFTTYNATTGGGIAVKTDGTLWGWGRNDVYQLAQLDIIPRSSPVQIGTLSDWSKVTAGNSIFAIKTNGTLWGWSSNAEGQLGSNNTITRSSPVQIGTLTDWSKIDSPINNGRILAIRTGGTLWGAGLNTSGELGLFISNQVPNLVTTNQTFNEISAGSAYNLAVGTNNSLWAWGINSSNQLGTNDSVARSSPTQIGTLNVWSKVSAGKSNHSATIRTNGTLWVWGNNTAGKLGLNDTTTRSSPVQVGTLADWTEISCGTSHTMGIRTNGTLWAWGFNIVGSLGLQISQGLSRSSPTQVGTLTWSKVQASTSHTIAIRANGTLWAWGSNSVGRLGLNITAPSNRSSPVQVGTLAGWSEISVGYLHNLALRTDGTLWSWGQNSNGELGTNDTIQRSSPVQVGTDTNWSKIEAGNAFSRAIKTNGTLWGWGLNTSGQLGNNTLTDISSPVQIGTATNWSKLSSGDTHSLTLDTNSIIYSNGAVINALGYDIDFVSSRSNLTQIGTLNIWSKVSSGNTHTLVLRTNGTLWSMGLNTNGELGLGNNINRSSPVQVGTLNTWTEIATGNLYSLAIQSNGTLWSWGSNTNGVLGINDSVFVPRSSPVQVGTLSDWSKVFAKLNTVHAIKTDGTLWGWGLNTQGQIGNNTTTSLSSPVQVGTLTNWLKVVGGVSHTMFYDINSTLFSSGARNVGLGYNINFVSGIGESIPYSVLTPNIVDSGLWSVVSPGSDNYHGIKTDGTLWAWGINDQGQLGIGNDLTRSIPIQVGSLTNWVDVKDGQNFFIAKNQYNA